MLTNLIIEGTCSHSILLDSYVALHAGLVASLHKIIGIELGALGFTRALGPYDLRALRSRLLRPGRCRTI